MKIKLTHSAQVAGSKGKVEQHPPGKKLDIDDEQANRLIANGYAVKDAPETVQDDENSAGGGGGTGGGAGTGTGTGAGGPAV